MTTSMARWIASLVLVAGLVVACTPRPPIATQTAPANAAAPAASLATAPDRFLAIGDVRLRYRELGQGEPVVLLHGFTGRLEEWLAVADSLALDHRVIALDERGFGQSSKFTEPDRFGTAMADDVVRLLDHRRIRRAHLVGYSLGAVIAANVAARYPARLASVSLIAPPAYADSAAAARAMAPWIADLERGAGLARFGQWLFPGMPDSVAAGGSAAILAANPPATLAAVLRAMGALMVPATSGGAGRVPALVAAGTGDPLLAQARWLASWWPEARLLELPGANHATTVSHPDVLTAMRALIRARRTASWRPTALALVLAHTP